MTYANVICPIPESRWLRQPTLDMLEAMARKPLEIKRSEARAFLRQIFGQAGMGYEPQGTGQRVFRLPGTNDALVLDYGEPVAPFEPSRVIARVHWGAVRTVFLPRGRLDRVWAWLVWLAALASAIG